MALVNTGALLIEKPGMHSISANSAHRTISANSAHQTSVWLQSGECKTCSELLTEADSKDQLFDSERE